MNDNKTKVAWIRIHMNPKGGICQAHLYDLKFDFTDKKVDFDLIQEENAPTFFKRKMGRQYQYYRLRFSVVALEELKIILKAKSSLLNPKIELLFQTDAPN